MIVIGVDPGVSGALAAFNYKLGAIDITDMPTIETLVAGRRRPRIDAVELLNYFELQKAMGAELVMIEAVGQRPGQANMFAFGYGVGLIYMACIAVRLPIESVAPQTWKKLLRVPGKKHSEPGDIIRRADELLPDHRETWRGAKGGLKVDRAEAALLATYGVQFALRAANVTDIDAWFESYKNAASDAP